MPSVANTTLLYMSINARDRSIHFHACVVVGLVAGILGGCDQLPTGPETAGSRSASELTWPASDTGPTVPPAPEPLTTPADIIQSVTGGRTRIVWIRDLGDGTDILGFGDQVVLMGLDTGHTSGEQMIVATPGTYAKPLITPRGDRVIYANRQDDGVYLVNWDGTKDTRLVSGFPLVVWIDPTTGDEWVYVGTDARGTAPESYGAVHRHPIDRPDTRELVWDKRAVNGDSFQVSRDGRLAGALARWPDAGVLELPNGEWRQLGEGCWTSLAGDDSGLFWYLDGQHRNLTMVDTETSPEDRWTVNINGAPGIGGYEIYHPRWSNHPRFLTMTGPYTVGGADNKIRGGGHGVEVHIGRFAEDHRSVEAWVQATTNEDADFYPDVWVDPMTTVPTPEPRDAALPATEITAAPIVVDVQVTADVPIPTPLDIAPYRNGLLVLEYEVIAVVEGTYAESTLLAAHWIIRDAMTLENAARPSGMTMRLRLDPYTSHAELEGERLVMDSDRFDLPVFYDVDSAP